MWRLTIIFQQIIQNDYNSVAFIICSLITRIICWKLLLTSQFLFVKFVENFVGWPWLEKSHCKKTIIGTCYPPLHFFFFKVWNWFLCLIKSKHSMLKEDKISVIQSFWILTVGWFYFVFALFNAKPIHPRPNTCHNKDERF